MEITTPPEKRLAYAVIAQAVIDLKSPEYVWMVKTSGKLRKKIKCRNKNKEEAKYFLFKQGAWAKARRFWLEVAELGEEVKGNAFQTGRKEDSWREIRFKDYLKNGWLFHGALMNG